MRRELLMQRLAGDGCLPAVELAAPRFFGLGDRESHQRLTGFLRKLVAWTLQRNRVVCIDFRRTEKFFSDGTLLFYAELQRIFWRRPNSVRCRPPRDPVALQVLSHLGLLRQLGINRLFPSDRDDVTHWKVFFGTQADATQGVGEAIASIPRLPQTQIGKLFRSVSEALTNVTQHAYLEPRHDGTGLPTDSGWWMFVREEPDELVVSFCDLGIGVPYTVQMLQKHANWLLPRLRSALRAVGVHTHKDGEIIRATVDEKRSRFRLEHRGNGFANMVEAISSAGNGTMVIHSNRGAFRYDLRDGKEHQQAINYAESIYGTVIGWKISRPRENP